MSAMLQADAFPFDYLSGMDDIEITGSILGFLPDGRAICQDHEFGMLWPVEDFGFALGDIVMRHEEASGFYWECL